MMEESRVGTTIAKSWRLDEVLGRGGMATVYAATHTSGRRAAFKIMHLAHRRNVDLRERFREEHRLSQLLDHPDRVEVYGLATTDDGVPILVMELLDGETMAARWRRVGRLTPHAAIVTSIALLDQLAGCHAKGIVHRDLKPENVFLARDGRVRLLDFGTARGRRSITQRRLAIGTPAFMPPEQARGERDNVDPRSDIFAVGALIWSVVSGHPLRKGRSDRETLRQASSEPPRSLSLVASELPALFTAVVDRALQMERHDRWQNARAMQGALINILQQVPREKLEVVAKMTNDRPTIPATPSSLAAAESTYVGKCPSVPRIIVTAVGMSPDINESGE